MDASNTRIRQILFVLALWSFLAIPAGAQPWGRYLCLDGSGDYASVADNASLDLGTGATDDFTIETFFYVPDLTNTTLDTLIWKQGSYGLYVIYFTSQADRFIFRIYTGGSNYVYLYANVDLGAGWHHVAAIWDNEYTSSWDYLAIYVDGTRVAYSDSNLEMTPGLINTTSAVYVGGYASSNPTVGGLEETRLSSSVRYSGASYTVPASPFVNDSDTRALWRFNAAPGATVFADSSSNGNTLTGSGDAQTCGDPCPAITITPGTLPDGVQGVAYGSQTLEASGGIAPYSYTVTSGVLPDGLSLGSDGSLSGTPTAASTYPFTVTAIDANDCTGEQSYSITITAVNASPELSTISASPESVTADGSTSTITVQLKDSSGVNLTTSGGTVELWTDLGSLSAVVDHNDGTYTATLTASTWTGVATVSGAINAVAITDTATVTFVPGPATAPTSTIDAAPATVTADGVSSSTVTVQLKDAYGNNLTAGGDTVTLLTDLGGLSGVVDNANGTYTASLTSTTAGLATISGTVNGASITNTAQVTFAPGAASTTTSTIEASPTSIVANGAATSTITVQLEDAHGNNLTASGGSVLLFTDRGTLGSVTDNANGTYTATLTSSTTAGTATITGTLDGSPFSDSATVSFTFGAPSTLVATPTSATQVVLDWTGNGGHHYEIYRATSGAGPYTSVGTSFSPAFTDNSVSSGVAYLYKAVAIDGASSSSGFSNIDVATTVVFTNDPLVAGVHTISAVHLTQLRTAVNAVRTTSGLGAATYTDESLSGVVIKRLHVVELRNALDAARAALGLPAVVYADPAIAAGVTPVRATHGNDLRDGVK